MSNRKPTPPTAEQFVKLPRDLLRSDAWRSLSINSRRFIDFLMLEHLSRGGKHNGDLKATDQQLRVFGIGAHHVASAISDTEKMGLVDCLRGGMRVASKYALTWLPLHDGTAATNQWRTFQNPKLKPLPTAKIRNLPAKQQAEPTAKIRNLPAKQQAELPAKQQADGANLPAKQQADRPKTLPAKQQVLSRYSYQGGNNNSDLSAPDGVPVAAAPVAVAGPVLPSAAGKSARHTPTYEIVELDPAKPKPEPTPADLNAQIARLRAAVGKLA
jgi:hypothetical protein